MSREGLRPRDGLSTGPYGEQQEGSVSYNRATRRC